MQVMVIIQKLNKVVIWYVGLDVGDQKWYDIFNGEMQM